MKKSFVITIAMMVCITLYMSAQIIENFETIPLNVMMGGYYDESSMTIVPNPDQNGINTSETVVKFVRDKDGLSWGGFWSLLPVPPDLTNNKYIHVKVWKPRISPIRFKVEDGNTTDLEISSMEDQTLINQWEEMVFDFSEKTGIWNTISFMPDFEDPLSLNEDIIMYFDDIYASTDSTPTIDQYATFNVDMTGAVGHANEIVFDPEIHDVYISGDMIGFWPEPGSDPAFKMSTLDQIHYTITLPVSDGQYIEFKYFFTAPGEITWENGEWSGDPNRHHIITNNITLNQTWGNSPVPVTFIVDMSSADPFNPETDDVFISGELLSNWNEPGTIGFYKMEPLVYFPSTYSVTLMLYRQDHDYKYFRVVNGNPTWDYGEWPGDPNRTATVESQMVIFDTWGLITGIYNQESTKIDIYPNPAISQATLEYTLQHEEPVSVFVFNMNGQLIENLDFGKQVAGLHRHGLNLDDYPSGIYFYKITFGSNTATGKLIVE